MNLIFQNSDIRIISNDWGAGNREDILAVLTSVAEIIFPLEESSVQCHLGKSI